MDEPTLSELQRRVARFVEERAWHRFHNAKNLSISIAIEAAELMEHFQWLSADQVDERLQDPALRAEVASELADVLIYALSFAEATGIDLAASILDKMAHNERRFPPDQVRNRLGDRPGGGHRSATEEER